MKVDLEEYEKEKARGEAQREWKRRKEKRLSQLLNKLKCVHVPSSQGHIDIKIKCIIKSQIFKNSQVHIIAEHEKNNNLILPK